MPNIVDTAMRDADPKIRYRRAIGEPGERAGLGKQIAREALPTESLRPRPLVDFFGNDVEAPWQKDYPTGVFLLRLFSPVTPRHGLEGKQLAALQTLMAYNDTKALGDPADPPVWFQEPSRKVSVRYRNKPELVREDMNEDEYYLHCKLSGQLLAQMIERREWDPKNATRRDVMYLERAIERSRQLARTPIQQARQAKALGRLELYDRLISQIKERVEGAETD